MVIGRVNDGGIHLVDLRVKHKRLDITYIEAWIDIG